MSVRKTKKASVISLREVTTPALVATHSRMMMSERSQSVNSESAMSFTVKKMITCAAILLTGGSLAGCGYEGRAQRTGFSGEVERDPDYVVGTIVVNGVEYLTRAIVVDGETTYQAVLIEGSWVHCETGGCERYVRALTPARTPRPTSSAVVPPERAGH